MVDFFALLLFCFVSFLSLSYYLFKPSNYIIVIITVLQLCLLILQLQVFLRNQDGESSKQGIQAACSILIHHVEW